MNVQEALERGGESFGRSSWQEACAQLSEADHQLPLDAEDLERLVVAFT